VTITFPVTDLASFSEERSAYIVEKGVYFIRVGTSSDKTFIAGALNIDETAETYKTASLMGTPSPELSPVKKSGAAPVSYEGEEQEKEQAAKFAIPVQGKYIKCRTASYTTSKSPAPLPECDEGATLDEVRGGLKTLEQLVAKMSVWELSRLCCGPGMDFSAVPTADGAIVGASDALPVPGAAGGAPKMEKYGIPQIILADGPAGIRITREVPETETRPAFKQNCTAFPVGTALASSWDPELLESVGAAVAMEMAEYGVDVWLAPGMNIQRNPLCGRNFEYFSEDPLVAGNCAAAITRGVQKNGKAVTIKHFAGNNQENMRTNMTDYISQRALREIYLKGFEIAVRTAQPLAIMTSYNDINGVPSAENFDLCTAMARDEWGFDGLIMTDWGGGVSRPALSIYAGNDMMQPGGDCEVEELCGDVESGKALTSRGEAHYEAVATKAMLQRSALRILKVIMKLK
jgi:beta-glucosidase